MHLSSTNITALFCVALTLSVAPALGEEKLVATVNGKSITEADLRLTEEDLHSELIKLAPESRKIVSLNAVIEAELLAQAAANEKLLSREELENIDRFAVRLALRNYYFDKRIREALTDAETRRLYDAEIKKISPPEEVHARHILVGTQEQALELRKKISDGADFAALARQYSQDPTTNVVGGDLGYFVQGQMIAEIGDTAFRLQIGQVSNPLKTEFGWHLVRVEDRRPQQLPTFEDIKDQLKSVLVQRNALEVVEKLITSAKIDIVDSDLKRLADKAAETGQLTTEAVDKERKSDAVAKTAPEAAANGQDSFSGKQADQRSAAIDAAVLSPPLVRSKGAFITYENSDLSGGDFRRLKNVEANRCVAECGTDSKCQAFSYDKWNKWCFLKAGGVVLLRDPSTTSGVRKDIASPSLSSAMVRFDRRMAKKLIGHSYRTAVVDSVDACESNCQTEQKCFGYKFNDKGTCDLFDRIDTFSTDRTAISGFKTQNTP